jgi:ATP-dependent RNA helicase DDX5/DBP2
MLLVVVCAEAETKKGADSLTRALRMDGWPSLSIHGDKSQQERDWVLDQFRTGKSPIMIATDVAARGLDVKDITVVINYDFPSCLEDYVHRVGRTGRAGATGIAYTFFTSKNFRHAKGLIKLLNEGKQTVPPQLYDFAQMAKSSKGDSHGRWNRGGYSKYSQGGGGGGGGFSSVNSMNLGYTSAGNYSQQPTSNYNNNYSTGNYNNTNNSAVSTTPQQPSFSSHYPTNTSYPSSNGFARSSSAATPSSSSSSHGPAQNGDNLWR